MVSLGVKLDFRRENRRLEKGIFWHRFTPCQNIYMYRADKKTPQNTTKQAHIHFRNISFYYQRIKEEFYVFSFDTVYIK